MESIQKKDMETKRENENENENENEILKMYLNQLTPFQMKANDIAKEKLDSSYCIEKSIGFLDFKKVFDKK